MKSIRLIAGFAMFAVIFAINAATLLSADKYVIVKPKSGDGASILLNRYKLPADKYNLDLFKELNPKKFDKNGGLLKGVTYKLPIRIYKYDGKSIRSTIKGIDKETALKVEEYNKKVLDAGLVKTGFKKSKTLWAPMCIIEDAPRGKKSDDSADSTESIIPRKKSQTKTKIDEPTKKKEVSEDKDKDTDKKKSDSNGKKKGSGVPFLGEKYKKIDKIDNSLEDCVYYLDPGHGGCDPGAVGKNGKYSLSEDEYAYDVVLRMARELQRHGATVYVLVHDDKDGIRDDAFLSSNSDEYYFGGGSIAENQRERLMARAEIVDELYEKHKKTAKIQQLIVIHLDSRVVNKRVDIFYYYKPGSSDGKELAQYIYNHIKKKYDASQPGRGYTGTVTSRNLLMLRETKPTGVYIELGNIQNHRNQLRFIDKNNRQALANWFTDALLKYAKNAE